MEKRELVAIKKIVEKTEFTPEQDLIVGKAMAIIQKEFDEHPNMRTTDESLLRVMKALDSLSDGTETTKDVLDFMKKATVSACGWEIGPKERIRLPEPEVKKLPQEPKEKANIFTDEPSRRRSRDDDYCR